MSKGRAYPGEVIKMMKEILGVADEPRTRRRWFHDEHFDLFVWQTLSGELVSFQLCYGQSASEQALVWNKESGFFRDGSCSTYGSPGVAHLVCVKVTREFLEFSRERGNDLITPRPELRFRGLKPGDRWCLHVLRWVEAWEAGMAPRVVLEATHENVLQLVPLTALKRHAAESG